MGLGTQGAGLPAAPGSTHWLRAVGPWKEPVAAVKPTAGQGLWGAFPAHPGSGICLHPSGGGVGRPRMWPRLSSLGCGAPPRRWGHGQAPCPMSPHGPAQTAAVGACTRSCFGVEGPPSALALGRGPHCCCCAGSGCTSGTPPHPCTPPPQHPALPQHPCTLPAPCSTPQDPPHPTTPCPPPCCSPRARAARCSCGQHWGGTHLPHPHPPCLAHLRGREKGGGVQALPTPQLWAGEARGACAHGNGLSWDLGGRKPQGRRGGDSPARHSVARVG